MAEDTQALLKTCQLPVKKLNPRQYAAEIPSVPGMEVWFQRATDVVRKIVSGDIDIGIVGYDMLAEMRRGRRYRHRARRARIRRVPSVGGDSAGVGEINSMRELMALRSGDPLDRSVVTAYPNVASNSSRISDSIT